MRAADGSSYVAETVWSPALRQRLRRIVDATTGAIMGSFTVGGFPDAVLYDPQRALAMVPSAIGGNLTVIALAGPANNLVVDTVRT